MDHLMKRRRMGVFFPIVAALTILSGAGLYWRASGGLQAAWITSPSGLAFTIGGLAAIASFVGGLVLIGRDLAHGGAVVIQYTAGSGPRVRASGCHCQQCVCRGHGRSGRRAYWMASSSSIARPPW
jgi:hypothetical protein